MHSGVRKPCPRKGFNMLLKLRHRRGRIIRQIRAGGGGGGVLVGKQQFIGSVKSLGEVY